MSVLQENNNSKLFPIYLVVSFTNTPFGKIIKDYTKDKFSHVCISFDSTLDNMYSYNIINNINRRGGISFESISKYNQDGDLAVMVLFVKEHIYLKIKSNLSNYIANYDKTSYSVSNIFNILINKSKDYKYNLNMICSQFVDSMLKLVNIDITNKSSNLVTPGDIYKVKNPKIIKVYEGKIEDYNSDRVDKLIDKLSINKGLSISESANTNNINRFINNVNNKLSPQSIFESKVFPVQFTDDGDLIISNFNNLNINDQYYKSVKLIRIYKNSKNIEGLKYEATKLCLFSRMLEKRINDNNRKEDVVLLGKINNTFTQTLLIILRYDKDFNFSEYYDTSPFSDINITIKKSTIIHTADILKYILRPL